MKNLNWNNNNNDIPGLNYLSDTRVATFRISPTIKIQIITTNDIEDVYTFQICDRGEPSFEETSDADVIIQPAAPYRVTMQMSGKDARLFFVLFSNFFYARKGLRKIFIFYMTFYFVNYV